MKNLKELFCRKFMYDDRVKHIEYKSSVSVKLTAPRNSVANLKTNFKKHSLHIFLYFKDNTNKKK